MKYVWAFVSITTIDTLAASLIYQRFPEYRHFLLNEDDLVENISALFFFCAFLLGLYFFKKTKKAGSNNIFAVLSALGLIGFLDELSFGKRIIGFTRPSFFGVEVDALHDSFVIGYKITSELLKFHEIIFYLFMMSACMVFLILWFRYSKKIMEAASMSIKHPPYILILFFAALIFSALIFDLSEDLEIISCCTWLMLEELFEMNAAFALILCCFSAYELQPGKNT